MSQHQKMIYNFVARNVTIFNFSDTLDLNGYIIPTEAHAQLQNPMPILYDGDYNKVLGYAYLFRIENKLMCDMYLYSTSDEEKFLQKYKKLTPYLAFNIKAKHDNLIFLMECLFVSLTTRSNLDPSIGNLKDKVTRMQQGDYIN